MREGAGSLSGGIWPSTPTQLLRTRLDLLRGLGAHGQVGMKGLDSVSSLHLLERSLQVLTKGRSFSPSFLNSVTIPNPRTASERGGGGYSKHGGMSHQLSRWHLIITLNLEN